MAGIAVGRRPRVVFSKSCMRGVRKIGRLLLLLFSRAILRFLAVSGFAVPLSPEQELSNGGVVARFRLDFALFRAYIRVCIETNFIRIWPHVP